MTGRPVAFRPLAGALNGNGGRCVIEQNHSPYDQEAKDEEGAGVLIISFENDLRTSH
jgi:hypothetical protein